MMRINKPCQWCFKNSLLGRTYVNKLIGIKLVKDQNQESSLGFMFIKYFFSELILE